MDEQVGSSIGSDEQLVVFDLASESYGVDIGAVNTIIRTQGVTRIPGSPDFVEGVINLRGSIVPVIDLRRRFGLPSGETTRASRIVVMEVEGELIGMSVDSVAETVKLSPDALEPPSPVVLSAASAYVRAIGKLPHGLVTLLDIGRVVPGRDMEALTAAA